MGIPREHRIGRYELLVELGRGGMAELFLGRLVGAGGFAKLVAIKRILPHLAGDPQWRQMFLDEGRIAAHLSHPNVCQVFELDETPEGELYLVMEYLDGVPWHHLLAELPPARVLPIAAGVLGEAAEGLHFAHSLCDARGRPTPIVHRDVSPQNLFVTVDGACKVLDFGVSKMMTDGPRTRTGVIKGKLPYMSPEQIRGDAMDGRADVFSLGVCAWEALAGARLFDRATDFQIWKAITEEDPPTLTSRWPACPPAVDAVVMRALDRDPARRQASARVFADELRAAAGVVAGEPEIAEAVRTHCGVKLATRAAEVAAVLGARSVEDDPSASATLKQPVAATATLAAQPEPSMVVRRHGVPVTRPPSENLDDAAPTRELPQTSDAGISRDSFGDPALTAPELPSERRRLLARELAVISRVTPTDDASATAREIPSERRRLRGIPSRPPEDGPRDFAAERRASAPQLAGVQPRRGGSHVRTAIIAATVAAAATAAIVIYVTRRTPERERPAPPPVVEKREPAPSETPLADRLGKTLQEVDKVVAWSRQVEGAVGRGTTTATAPAEAADEPGLPVEKAAQGSFTISSQPLATIYVDGKKLGDTPLVKQSLAAGTHEVKAVLADGRERTLPIRISSGEETNAGTLSWP